MKATRAKRWGKVRGLQHLLTHSFSGKALAVRRVTENQGKSTPGVDYQTWNTPEKKAEAIHELRRHGYKPLPLKRVYTPKSPNGRERPLSIPTVRDRVVQQACKIVIEPIFEANFLDCSYGFRPRRSAVQAAQAVKVTMIKGKYAIDADIERYFDHSS